MISCLNKFNDEINDIKKELENCYIQKNSLSKKLDDLLLKNNEDKSKINNISNRLVINRKFFKIILILLCFTITNDIMSYDIYSVFNRYLFSFTFFCLSIPMGKKIISLINCNLQNKLNDISIKLEKDNNEIMSVKNDLKEINFKVNRLNNELSRLYFYKNMIEKENSKINLPLNRRNIKKRILIPDSNIDI